jgi:hypothetical protein
MELSTAESAVELHSTTEFWHPGTMRVNDRNVFGNIVTKGDKYEGNVVTSQTVTDVGATFTKASVDMVDDYDVGFTFTTTVQAGNAGAAATAATATTTAAAIATTWNTTLQNVTTETYSDYDSNITTETF